MYNVQIVVHLSPTFIYYSKHNVIIPLDKITVIYREYSKMCSIRYVDFTNPSPVSKMWPSKDEKKSTTPLHNLESEMNQIKNVK